MGILGLYAVVVLIWGSTWIAIQFQLSVAPEAAVAYRFALATLILMAWCGLRRLPMLFSRRDHLFMAALGVCLFSFNYVLIFFHRRPETRTVIGAVLGMAGISLVFARDLAAFDLATGGSIGLLLSLAGSYIASLGNMASARNHAHRIPVMQANAFGMLYGTVMLFGYIAVSGVPLIPARRSLPPLSIWRCLVR